MQEHETMPSATLSSACCLPLAVFVLLMVVNYQNFGAPFVVILRCRDAVRHSSPCCSWTGTTLKVLP